MRTASWGVSFLFVLGFSQFAAAQPMVPGGGFQRPSVSPYINLLRGNSGVSNAALNYYGIVRPEQQFRQQAGMLQQQLNQTNQNLGTLASGDGSGEPLLVTGKGATFLNYSHYYPLMGMGGAGTMGGGFSRGGGMAGMPNVGVNFNTGGGGSGFNRGMATPMRGGAAPSRGGRR